MSYGGPRLYTIVNVTNISRDMTNERIREMFEKYGRIASLKIMNENMETWRRFAYVAFEESDAADEAVIELNGQKIDNDRIRVRRTIKREPDSYKPSWSGSNKTIETPQEPSTSSFSNERPRRPPGYSVFVKNLDRAIQSVPLKVAFEPFGTVTSSKIIMEGNVSKGYGFVTFTTEEAAKKAIAGMNGRLFGTKIIGVEMSRGNDHNNADHLHPSFIRRTYCPRINPLLRQRSRQTSDDCLPNVDDVIESLRAHHVGENSEFNPDDYLF